MKKLFIIILTLISIPLYSADNNIYITQYNKVIGKLTPQQFELLINASDQYKEIILAQKEGRVNIQVLTDLEKTSIINQYKTVLKIQWLNSKNEEINFVSSVMFLNIDNQNESTVPEWRIVYRDVSEIGFPISSVLLLLIIVVLL